VRDVEGVVGQGCGSIKTDEQTSEIELARDLKRPGLKMPDIKIG
jgi:hypothetical protein